MTDVNSNANPDTVHANENSFTEINLTEKKRQKTPKRLVYFSDGILEEFSSDEEELDCSNDTQPLIDPKTLAWIPYLGYLIWLLGARTLAVCDYLGEHLAWILGITSPKFQYEIEQYKRMVQEEEELAKHTALENAGWMKNTEEVHMDVIAMQPQGKTKDNVAEPLVTTDKTPLYGNNNSEAESKF